MRKEKSRKRKFLSSKTSILEYPFKTARELNESSGGILRDLGLIFIPLYIKHRFDDLSREKVDKKADDRADRDNKIRNKKEADRIFRIVEKEIHKLKEVGGDNALKIERAFYILEQIGEYNTLAKRDDENRNIIKDHEMYAHAFLLPKPNKTPPVPFSTPSKNQDNNPREAADSYSVGTIDFGDLPQTPSPRPDFGKKRKRSFKKSRKTKKRRKSSKNNRH